MTRSMLQRSALAGLMAGALVPTGAGAAGFALIEQGAKGQGTAYAGNAVTPDDPATVFFNPAGMARMEGRSSAAAAHVIAPSFDFSDDGSTMPAFTGGGPIAGEESSDGGETEFVPNLYYVQPVNDRWTFGVGVNVPFGLTTDYDPEWVGRYHAVTSELATLNVNPSLALDLNDAVSLGVGVNVQYADATLSNRIDSETVCIAAMVAPCGGTAGNPDDDSSVEVTGDSWGYGFNLGLLADIADRTQLGIAWRSRVQHTLEGEADFSYGTAGFETFAQSGNVFVDTDAEASIDLPETLTVSVRHEPVERLAVLTDLTWTRWSRLEELRVEFDSDQDDSVTPLNWENTLRAALGFTWQHSEALQLRTGIAYDESPVPSAQDRTARIPDNDRRWLSVGFGYRPLGTGWEWDAGYSKLFISDTRIDNTNSTGHTLTGDYDSDVDIVSVQGTWRY